MYDDEYYDDEVDFDTEEAQAYQQALQMQAAGIPANVIMGAQQDAEIMRAEQALGEGFEIMEEELDEDYEPTTEEIEEYAKYLGMDLNDDKDLFYIAKEGLKAPLPNPWKPCRSPGESIYYYNFSNQGLQKEHPCDDYYKNYYIKEKGNKRKKKEEQVVKKQIKEQQKKQKLSTSMNSTNQNPNNQSNAGNNSIHQMALMMNMSGLDMSTSVVNERVQVELEQIMDEYEEKKIQHERKRRDELKKLEQDKSKDKQRVSEDIKMQVDLIKKNHIKSEKQTEHKIDKKKDGIRKDEENRHKLESDNVKQKFKTKLDIERDRVREENNRLLEESGDIDFQVRLFKSEMLEGQVESQKYEIDEEFRAKFKDYKLENKKNLEKERERITAEFLLKLEREKEKEIRKSKLEQSKIEDKKEQLRKDMNAKTKEDKKRLEKEWNHKMREKRIEADEEIDRAKNDLKKQILKTYEAREERIEKEFETQRYELKTNQDKYEKQSHAKLQLERDNVDREYEQQWKLEKQEFINNENEKSESYQAIIKEIQSAKTKYKDLESKEQQLSKEYKLKVKEVGDLEMEKRSKERQTKTNESSDKDNIRENQLQKELREKQEELDRINLMIRDKKEQQRKKVSGSNIQGEDYHSLIKELDSVKLMIMELKNNTNSITKKSQNTYNKNIKRRPVESINDYSLAEIETFIDVYLPKIKHKREKHDQDRLILRQLIANIERNRMKLRKDILGATSNLSQSRRIAVQSIKEKIDEQAMILSEEESQIKERAEYYRRKEEKLRIIKQKLDIVKGDDKYESDLEEDRKDALMKEIQIDYDKYLKLYQKDEEFQKQSKTQVRNQDLQNLQNKWADHLIDDADDLKPLIGFDPSRQLFKPRSLYQKYQMSGSKYQENITLNHIYEREIEKVKENRSKMRDFLGDQQRWLSNMKADLTHKSGAVPISRTMLSHVGSNETLFQLKNNLSQALQYY